MRWGVRSMVAGGVLAVALVFALPAHAAWHELEGGASPINHAAADNATDPDLAIIGGVPYVAWDEFDGTNTEIRVSKLSADGTTWNEVVGGASPINHDPNMNAAEPSITSIGGVPYVAWYEVSPNHNQIRVSKLNAAGTAWQEIVGGASPINHASVGLGAYRPSLTAIGGEPYVAWIEDDGSNVEMRVSKFDGTAWTEVVGGASPINHFGADAGYPGITGVGGVPYVVWTESEGSVNDEVFVSRLNGAGTAWEAVGPTSNPINHDTAESAYMPDITSIDGVPYVTWAEHVPGAFLVRVAKLNGAGTAWTEVVGGANPINPDSEIASWPTLTSIGGVPYVVRDQYDGANQEVRVSRLSGAGTAWTEVDPGPSPINHDPGRDGYQPQVEALGSGLVVAWSESDGTRGQIRSSYRDDGMKFSDGNYSVPEQSGPATITVERPGPNLGSTTVHYATSDGTAQQPGDYGASSGTLTFAAGETSKTFPVSIVNDTAPEPDETVQLTLSSPGGVGNLGAPATATLMIVDDDTVDTQITSGPSGPTNDDTPTFEFTATKPGASFVCSLDHASPTSCSSPLTVGPLADGDHGITVTATAPGAGTDTTPAQRSFFVDTHAPATSISITPAPGQGQDLGNGKFAGAIRIGGTANDPAPSSGASGVRCALDPATPPAVYTEMTQPCPVAVPWTLTPSPGTHTVYSASRDPAANNGLVVSTSFTIAAKPTVTITGGPDDFTWFKTPQFTFTGSSGATFRCRLDADAFAPCTSPWLAPSRDGGLHVFEVKAVSAEGAESDVADRSYVIEEPTTHRYTCELKPYLGIYRSKDYGCTISTVRPGYPHGFFCENNNTACSSIPDACPIGAQCTVVSQGTYRNGDPFGGRDYTRVLMRTYPAVPAGSPIHENRAYCQADAGGSCTVSARITAFGEPSSIGTACYGPELFPERVDPGADGQRSLTCEGMVRVIPAAALAAAAQGASVSVNAPGAGSVGVAPGGGSGKAGSAKGKPAFKAVILAASGPGPVTFKPKLKRTAKKALKKKHKLKLGLAITYTPAGGGDPATSSANVKLTTPKRRRRR